MYYISKFSNIIVSEFDKISAIDDYSFILSLVLTLYLTSLCALEAVRLIFQLDEKTYSNFWDSFTRVISTLNAIHCSYTVYKYCIPNWNDYMNLNYTGNDEVVRCLMWFSSYLFVDGFFCVLMSFNENFALSTIIHHFVGGFGIYLIHSTGKGLGLGGYFALTEISTPLLHISWIIHKYDLYKKFKPLIIVFVGFYFTFFFYRILSISYLGNYLLHNYNDIIELKTYETWMVFGGSFALVSLNVTWFVLLTSVLKKLFTA